MGCLFCCGEGERGGRTKGGRVLLLFLLDGIFDGVQGGRFGERMNCVCVEGGGCWRDEEGLWDVGEEICRGGEDGGEGDGKGEEEMDIGSMRRFLLSGVDMGEGGSEIGSLALRPRRLVAIGPGSSTSASDATSSISSFRAELVRGKRGGCRGISGDEELLAPTAETGACVRWLEPKEKRGVDAN